MKKPFTISYVITGGVLGLYVALFYISPAFAAGVYNPLGPRITIPIFIGNAINAILGILGAVSLFMVTYGGFLWLVSAGNPDKVTKGRRIFTWSFFGLMVVFGSYVFTAAILGPVSGTSIGEQTTTGPRTGCEERGPKWSCVSTPCNSGSDFDEYSTCVSQFNQANSNSYNNCVPGPTLCGAVTELCCESR